MTRVDGLEHAGRYEWERLVRRVVMPRPVKLLAFILSSYADPDGSRVRPGNHRLQAVLGDASGAMSDKQVRRLLAVLRDELGLLERTVRGGGRGGAGKTDVYRLAIPEDLLDRATLLSPDEEPHSPDIQMSGQFWAASSVNGHRADTQVSAQSTDSPDTQMSAQSRPSPVDNPIPQAVDNSNERTSECPVNVDPPERLTGHFGPPPSRLTGHFEPIDRTSGCPTTTHIPTT